MSALLVFSLLLSQIFFVAFPTEAAVALFPADQKYLTVNKCYSKMTGGMDFGASKTLKPCMRATCLSSGMIDLVTCGVVMSSSKNCRVVSNLSLPYPNCCERIICD